MRNGCKLLQGNWLNQNKGPLAALMFLALLAGGALFGLIVEGLQSKKELGFFFDTYFVSIAGFTVWQAAMSTLFSLVPAILVARALHRHPAFFGRAFVLRLMALPLALPALVGAIGLLALFGRAGAFAPLLTWTFDTKWPGIYGLGGIVVAHVFFNMPLAARLLLAGLQAVPNDHWRIAAQLGFSPKAMFLILEWPALKAAIPGVAVLIFVLCATSFTLVLTLGGGPQFATFEVAIYQALRFDYAPERAVVFALVQLFFSVGLALTALRLASIKTPQNTGLVKPGLLGVSRVEALVNAALIGGATGFVVMPLMAIFVRGLNPNLIELIMKTNVTVAILTSLTLAFFAGFFACLTAIVLLSAKSNRIVALANNGGGVLLSVSPIVIGAGWFVVLHGTINPLNAAPMLIILINAFMALPFVLRLLSPLWAAERSRNDRLSASLGLIGWARFKAIEGRALQRPLWGAFALAMALSIGDFGVVALFGSENLQTLPSLLFASLGSYRTQDAAGLALILMLFCLCLLWLSDYLAKMDQRT